MAVVFVVFVAVAFVFNINNIVPFTCRKSNDICLSNKKTLPIIAANKLPH
jgi:hypothetical protein